MGVHKMPINPCIPWQIARIFRQFAGGQHNLPIRAVNVIPIHIDTSKFVIGPNFLNLRIRVHKRAAIPQRNTLYGSLIICDIIRGQIRFAGKRHLLDLVQTICFARVINSMLNIGLFSVELIGPHNHQFKDNRDKPTHDNERTEIARRAKSGNRPCANAHVVKEQTRENNKP